MHKFYFLYVINNIAIFRLMWYYKKRIVFALKLYHFNFNFIIRKPTNDLISASLIRKPVSTVNGTMRKAVRDLLIRL